jgi:ubiquinone/menaquinone biosynthesis C-methylase UbiE
VSRPHEHRPTHRFSRRVADYARFRPSYPLALPDWLRETVSFTSAWRVADVGSGTGIFSRLLLEHGNHVHAVEPNDAMRAEAEASLRDYLRFVSVRGTAEATTLPDRAFDLVTVAQAFHWFDAVATRKEFQRILKPGAWTLIVFNSRRITASPFMRAYDELLQARAVDYARVDHRLVDAERLRAFLGNYREWRTEFSQFHDLEGLTGLSSSSSYTPAPDHPDHESFYAALCDLFAAHEVDGKVEFLYETEAYLGRMGV